jgi:hypothetical protein
MPKEYENRRDQLIREGYSEKAAKTRAAKEYNSRHPEHPVTRKHKKKR